MKDAKRFYIVKIIAMLMRLDEVSCRNIYLMVTGATGEVID